MNNDDRRERPLAFGKDQRGPDLQILMLERKFLGPNIGDRRRGECKSRCGAVGAVDRSGYCAAGAPAFDDDDQVILRDTSDHIIRIAEELLAAARVPMIDSTRRSVEEIAALIVHGG